MTVASGVTVGWPSDASGVGFGALAGWLRNTTLDGFVPRGAAAGVDPGSTGGSATHTHTGSSHTHNIVGHVHDAVTTAFSEQYPAATGWPAGTVPYNWASAHNLPQTNASATDALPAQTGTWSSTNATPTLTVVFIQSDGTAATIPAYALAYWNSTTLPSGWATYPALALRYLQGAAPGASGGVASGGPHTHSTLTHTHGPSTGHTHTASATTSGPTVFAPESLNSGLSAQLDPAQAHTHSVSSISTLSVSVSDIATGSPVSSATRYDPPYYVLIPVQASTAGVPPVGLIALWTGTLASIPSGWVLCNGTNSTPDLRTQFVRGSSGSPYSDLGATGGAAGHTHTAAAHMHVIPAHAHAVSLTGFTYTQAGAADIGSSGTAASILATNQAHFHGGTVTGALLGANATDAGSMTLASVADSRPTFFDVAFIQYQASGTVAVTTPASLGTITTPVFTAAWTLSGGRTQATYRVKIATDAGITSVVFDSGTVTTATQSATVPTVSTIPSVPSQPGLANGITYYFQVTCVDTNGLTTVSSAVQFATAWTAPVNPTAPVLTPIGGT